MLQELHLPSQPCPSKSTLNSYSKGGADRFNKVLWQQLIYLEDGYNLKALCQSF